jgi:hypothetical protein
MLKKAIVANHSSTFYLIFFFFRLVSLSFFALSAHMPQKTCRNSCSFRERLQYLGVNEYGLYLLLIIT